MFYFGRKNLNQFYRNMNYNGYRNNYNTIWRGFPNMNMNMNININSNVNNRGYFSNDDNTKFRNDNI